MNQLHQNQQACFRHLIQANMYRKLTIVLNKIFEMIL